MRGGALTNDLEGDEEGDGEGGAAVASLGCAASVGAQLVDHRVGHDARPIVAGEALEEARGVGVSVW